MGSDLSGVPGMRLMLDDCRRERDNLSDSLGKHKRLLDEAVETCQRQHDRIDALEATILAAMAELGVPDEGYPKPVASAYRILGRAFGS